ncbi:MAG: hypothetical protein HC824_05825 [Synechococcales cyanobacterium RM1_1_8]|nr:hypothetical protein [Synechococcales cyanobacterium RM1_1_8]
MVASCVVSGAALAVLFSPNLGQRLAYVPLIDESTLKANRGTGLGDQLLDQVARVLEIDIVETQGPAVGARNRATPAMTIVAQADEPTLMPETTLTVGLKAVMLATGVGLGVTGILRLLPALPIGPQRRRPLVERLAPLPLDSPLAPLDPRATGSGSGRQTLIPGAMAALSMAGPIYTSADTSAEALLSGASAPLAAAASSLSASNASSRSSTPRSSTSRSLTSRSSTPKQSTRSSQSKSVKGFIQQFQRSFPSRSRSPRPELQGPILRTQPSTPAIATGQSPKPPVPSRSIPGQERQNQSSLVRDHSRQQQSATAPSPAAPTSRFVRVSTGRTASQAGKPLTTVLLPQIQPAPATAAGQNPAASQQPGWFDLEASLGVRHQYPLAALG